MIRSRGRASAETAVLWPDQGPPEPTGAARPEAQRSPASWPAVDSQDGSGLRGVGRALLPWLAAAIGLAVAVQAAWLVSLLLQHQRAGLDQFDLDAASPVASGAARSRSQPSPKPIQALAPVNGPSRPTALIGWAERLAPRVGIPPVALAAYGNAELALAAEEPGCHLSWVALAGIGRVESDHGRFGGATLLPDGRSDPPIVGVALDGNGVAAIADSDDGRYDGDPQHDRAVGPMQFIPTTWARYGADADGDGRADPFAMPDAALAAGRYLCRSAGGDDLRRSGPWSAALWSYNRSSRYAALVTDHSNSYAQASRG